MKEIGSFYNSINKIAHATPADMIINIDQTPLSFVFISKYTLAEKGSSRVSVSGTSDYHQITGTGTTLQYHLLLIGLYQDTIFDYGGYGA